MADVYDRGNWCFYGDSRFLNCQYWPACHCGFLSCAIEWRGGMGYYRLSGGQCRYPAHSRPTGRYGRAQNSLDHRIGPLYDQFCPLWGSLLAGFLNCHAYAARIRGSTHDGDLAGYAYQRLSSPGAWARSWPQCYHRRSWHQHRPDHWRPDHSLFLLALDLLCECADWYYRHYHLAPSLN